MSKPIIAWWYQKFLAQGSLNKVEADENVMSAVHHRASREGHLVRVDKHRDNTIRSITLLDKGLFEEA